jgi:hypothetical protein
MAPKKSICILFGILAISVWVLGSAIQAGAETWNYKFYNYVEKREAVSVGDVEDHGLALEIRRTFLLFENGEVATAALFAIADFMKDSGSNISYSTITFSDGSTISIKREVRWVGAVSETKGGITKGTGRFKGIMGTQSAKAKYLPVEKGEVGPKGSGEGNLTFTLPSK